MMKGTCKTYIYIYPLCKKEEELRNIDLFIFTKRNRTNKPENNEAVSLHGEILDVTMTG